MRHEVRLLGQVVECTAAEFRLLASLAAAPYRVFTRRRLLEHAFGMDRFITERTIDVHIMKLRRKLEVDRTRPQRLVTVYGVGYKLVDAAASDPPGAQAEDRY